MKPGVSFRALLTVSVLIGSLCAGTQIAVSQTIHAILVGNTTDPNIGYGDKLDLDLIRGLLQDASRITGAPLKMKIFDDKIPRSQVMDTVKNLTPGSNDTVVFFYTGHGYRMRSFKEKWPAMALDGDRGGSAGLDLKWAYDVLKKKNPRFLLVMADACNSVLPEGSVDTYLSVSAGGENAASYRKLFLEHKGGILASSSVPGQYSYSGTSGSQFTVQFISSIKSELALPNPTWKAVMTKATRSIMGGQQQPQYAMDGAIGENRDPNPVPYKEEEIYRDDDSRPSGKMFGSLLVTMESNIPYSAQTKQWTGMRPGWIGRVAQAEGNLEKMKTELLLFEKHILWNAQKSEWKQRRDAWVGRVKSAGSVSKLADPLMEVEGSIKEGTFISLWARERPGWVQNVKNLSGGGGGDSYREERPVPGGSFGNLLIEFEEGVAGSAKSDDWNRGRNGWKSEVVSAGNDVSRLRQLLLDFESHIDYAAQKSDWPQRRPQWLNRTGSASTISVLKESLAQAEDSMNTSDQTQSWRQRRGSWLREVQGLR